VTLLLLPPETEFSTVARVRVTRSNHSAPGIPLPEPLLYSQMFWG
jgi:hypothetical protein